MLTSYRVSVAGPSVSLERIVSETLALQVLGVLVQETGSSNGAVGSGPAAQATAAAHTLGNSGLRSYLDTHHASDIVKKIAAIGAHLAGQGQDSFTSRELLAGFDAAREAAPKNISRDIHNSQRSGWIATRRGQRGTYFVTAKGLAAVEAAFATSQTRKPRRRAAAKRKA